MYFLLKMGIFQPGILVYQEGSWKILKASEVNPSEACPCTRKHLGIIHIERKSLVVCEVCRQMIGEMEMFVNIDGIHNDKDPIEKICNTASKCWTKTYLKEHLEKNCLPCIWTFLHSKNLSETSHCLVLGEVQEGWKGMTPLLQLALQRRTNH